MSLLLLVFIILLGIVGAILAMEKKSETKDEQNANDFEIME